MLDFFAPRNARFAAPWPKQLLVAIATIDFAFSKQNQCCFELKAVLDQVLHLLKGYQRIGVFSAKYHQCFDIIAAN